MNEQVQPKFGAVALVCRECEERSSGPKKLKTKAARKALKIGLLRAAVRVRVVESSCLGLCPKKAMALVAVGPGKAPLAAEARSEEEAEAFAATVLTAFR